MGEYALEYGCVCWWTFVREIDSCSSMSGRPPGLDLHLCFAVRLGDNLTRRAVRNEMKVLSFKGW